jgi:hypothetical protein
MASERDDQAKLATDVRLTFRTHTSSVEKLERIAKARDLTIGARHSVGAAINFVIDKYDDTEEQAKVKSGKVKAKPKRRRA